MIFRRKVRRGYLYKDVVPAGVRTALYKDSDESPVWNSLSLLETPRT